jgi:hypothetical protein
LASTRKVTIDVELQQRRLGLWVVTVDQESRPFLNPPAGKKSSEVAVSVPCDEGTFRTRARGAAIDIDGRW